MAWKSRAASGLACVPATALVLALVSLAPSAQEEPPSQEELEVLADTGLAQAEEHAAKGRYAHAHKGYERIAERYPDTDAGQTARRRSAPGGVLSWADVVRHGPAANRVEVFILGDGFVLGKQGSFDDVAEDVPRKFERDSVFGEYFGYVNFLRANVVSEEAGIDGFGREAATALGSAVSEATVAGLVTVDRNAVWEVLDQLPEHDGLALVLVPRGVGGTGGDGIAAVGGRDFETLMHEWGHAFAGLRDEYSTHTGYRSEVPHSINVSSSADPLEVPWAHWLEADVPGIGVYQGADGRVRGAWRPTASGCRMEQGEFFCRVCREALVLRIHEHVDPIEAARVRSSPEHHPLAPLRGADPHELEVVVMRPENHALDVRWWVLPERGAPPEIDASARPRTTRGPLAMLPGKGERTRERNGVHRFRVNPRDLAPGRWRVVCRVRDKTELRGDRWPWVLSDPLGLLESERGWWIEVAAEEG